MIGAIGQIALADTRTYQATTDFPVIDAGDVPYYSEAPNRPSLAINAANEAYRGIFARAEVVYDGMEGVHDLTLVSLAELDGEAQYRVLINGVIVGEATNPEVTIDYTVVRHSFDNITIPAGATIAVESLANTNGKIPEGDGTAFARGRWTALEMLEVTTTEPTPTPTDIDLRVSVSSNKQSLEPNEDVEIELTLSNAANSLTATQAVVSLTITPEAVDVVSAEQCTPNAVGLSCSFPEITAGESRSMTLLFTRTEEVVDLAITATVEADQDDRDGTNNVASINVAVVDVELEPDPESEPMISGGSSGGALSIVWFLLMLPIVSRKQS